MSRSQKEWYEEYDEGDLEAKDNVPKPSRQQTPREILEAAESINFSDENATNAFKNRYGATLSIKEYKSEDGNVLHELSGLALDTIGKENKWTRTRIKLFIDFILNESTSYGHLLETERQVGGHMPLHNALFKKNHLFVGVVLEKLKAEKSLQEMMKTILQHTTANKENCLHLAIMYNSEHTELLIDLCESISDPQDILESQKWATPLVHEQSRTPSVFQQRDKHNRTPLHYAAKVQDKDQYVVEPKFSDAPTVVPGRASELASRNTDALDYANVPQQPRGPEIDIHIATPLHAFHTPPLSPRLPPPPKQGQGAGAEGSSITQGSTLVGELSKLKSITVNAPATDRHQMMLVQRLTKADWFSLTLGPQPPGTEPPVSKKQKGDFLLTPFQLREADICQKVTNKAKKLLPKSNNDEGQAIRDFVRTRVEDELEKLHGNDEILSVIRDFCLEKFSRSRSTIMQCLYPPGRERHIEFSLSGLRRQSIHMDYLQQLASHLHFESVLVCVTLPRLRVELSSLSDDEDYSVEDSDELKLLSGLGVGAATTTKGRATVKSQKKKRGKGLSDLVAIFNWLRVNHVQKIKKIVVIDDGDPCHSDEAIERALGGFDVLVWDWKRPDVCSEVIFNCAPNVREVSLYWSGCQSTLLGWYCDQGFPSEKFKALKKIVLYYRKGLESETRLRSYLDTFKNRIEERKEQGTEKSKVHVDLQKDPEDKSFLSGFKSAGADLMDNAWFGAMRPILECVQTMPGGRPIKIAIIDDGIDASLPIFDHRVACGASFGTSLGMEHSATPYFVSSGHHGTLMGALILRMCPSAKLYIAKLDERYNSSGARSITASSAAESINWAVDTEVDIISMSWTIELANVKSREVQSRDLDNLEAAVKRANEAGILMFCAASDQGNSTMVECYPGNVGMCHRVGAATGTGERCAWVHPENYDLLLPGEKIIYDLQDPSSPSEHSGSSVATAVAAGLGGLLKSLYWQLNPDTQQDNFRQKKDMDRAFRYLGYPFPFTDKLGFLAGKNWKNGSHKRVIRDGLKKLFEDIRVSYHYLTATY
ncbi:hypothetical protein QQS21_011266 [Conoideocrella luteorostrata]|uniref:Peptidase S8/S53 domain-containing protein n=1 Tax=Conoideocrella luteorostrata TaxID=1105319 RepID=A0AAJ0CG61_9HYPO|nr:hypothetical protein QQS21_011266 [Conoideocrella luteorostrata]